VLRKRNFCDGGDQFSDRFREGKYRRDDNLQVAAFCDCESPARIGRRIMRMIEGMVDLVRRGIGEKCGEQRRNGQIAKPVRP